MNFASASGKVILVGEHAVVHGRPAIAVATKEGARATVRPTSSSARSTIRVHDPRGVLVTPADRFEEALAASLAAAGRAAPVDVEMHLAIPPGGGLGASAAMGVALARALDPSATTEALFRRAMAWEAVFHGTPSGVDVAASLLGGCIRFRRDELTRPIELGRRLRVCVGHSGASSQTSAVVARIGLLRSAAPRRVDGAFDRLGELAGDAEGALVRSDLAALGRVLDDAQRTLVDLELSTLAIDAMCTLARYAGAHGAKLSGAGRGGVVIAVADDDVVPRVISAWRRAGFPAHVIEAGPSSISFPSRHETFTRTLHE